MKSRSFGSRRNTSSGESNQLVFGIRAVLEAIHSGKEIENLYLQRGISGDLILELKSLLKERGLSFLQVPIEKLNRLTPKNHQGAVAYISPISYERIEDLIPLIFESGEVPFILVLDGVTDVRNFGAIARTAECAGVHAIVVPSKGSAQVNPDAIKTSAGALYKIPICRQENLFKSCKFLQESGIQLISCTEKTNDSLYKPDYTGPIALIMGAEDTGISTDILRISDHLARIPMFGEIESLNVSVSSGILMYEVIRQRTK